MTIAVQPASPITLETGSFDALRARLAGQLVTADSSDFDDARKTRDITLDRRPLAIVRAADARDVAEAVRFARYHRLPLAIRSGGHSIARYSLVDDAITIDLAGMKRIEIDPETRTTRVQAGATSGDLAEAAGAHGLALSTGDTASVAFGGLTTGGGIGYMVRKQGLTIDNLIAAEVVTADCEIVTASASEHPDLFWAIRGGGGNFGVVTEFTFQLTPVGEILGGEMLLPATRQVVRAYLEYAASAPDDLTTLASVMLAPPAPHVPQEHVGKLALSILVCWTGTLEEGERVLAPLRDLAIPFADKIGPMQYSEIYSFTEELTHPHAWSIRSMFANDLSDEALDVALAAIENGSSPYNIFHLRVLGGAMTRTRADMTAFAHRHQRFFVAIIGLWVNATEDADAHRAWVDSVWQSIRNEGSGVYVNFLEDEGADRVRDAYPPETYSRLADVKRRYDPENIFRFNQNVPPAP